VLAPNRVASWLVPPCDSAAAIESDSPSSRISVVPSSEGAIGIDLRWTAEELFNIALRHAPLKLSPFHLVRCDWGKSASLAQLLFKVGHSTFKDLNGLFKLLHPRLNGRLRGSLSSCGEK